MGSMVVFITVLGIARTKTWTKLSILCLLIFHCHANANWKPATFLQGVLLAELSFIYARPLEPTTPALDVDEKLMMSKQDRKYESLASKCFFSFLFLFSIWVGAQPTNGWDTTPGYQWMYNSLPVAYAKSPENRATFWPSIAAFFLIFALEMAPYLQSIFTTSIAQYLGEVSFSLYMIHFQIQSTLGEWLVPKMMNVTGGWENGEIGFVAGILLSVAILGPVTFWVADVFSRLVDEKCVKFARWISTKVFI